MRPIVKCTSLVIFQEGNDASLGDSDSGGGGEKGSDSCNI